MSNQKKGTRKPTLPPGMKPSKAKKPAGPKKAKKPKMPPGKKPSLPPGFSGDGGGRGLTRKDFQSDQDVRWCPGCGDYAILATVQRLLPELEANKEEHVFISGIGCSGRFPYYMDTYGLHSIHGRAPAIATGLKVSRPELKVWIISGDGDALSIGGNHLIHLLRRNLDVQLLLFNNEIYGLTKGQYSPTSRLGQVTKSSPYGSVDRPFNPVALALGAGASFVARAMDRDPKHLKETLRRSYEHRGAAFVEIYQNCNIFNDGAFSLFTDKQTKAGRALFLEHGQPLVYAEGKKGLHLDGLTLQCIDLEKEHWSASDCLVWNETDRTLAGLIGRLSWEAGIPDGETLPRPFGVLYRAERPTYEALVEEQIEATVADMGEGDLDTLLHRGDTWTIN